MKAKWLTIAGLSLCLTAMMGLAQAEAQTTTVTSTTTTWNDSIINMTERDANVQGVLKSIDTTARTFTVEVEDKGDATFRVSPQTRFDEKILGGLLDKEFTERLGGLKPGAEVKVQYLTLPPDMPVAVDVSIR